jgi:hypothetical protein
LKEKKEGRKEGRETASTALRTGRALHSRNIIFSSGTDLC